MKKILILTVLIGAGVAGAEEGEKFRSRFKQLNDKKIKASQDMDRLMAEIEKPTDQHSLAKKLEDYSRSLTAYNSVQVEEAKTMRKILGDKRFAQYLILKRDLSQKLKNMLSSPSRQEASTPKE